MRGLYIALVSLCVDACLWGILVLVRKLLDIPESPTLATLIIAAAVGSAIPIGIGRFTGLGLRRWRSLCALMVITMILIITIWSFSTPGLLLCFASEVIGMSVVLLMDAILSN